MATPILSNSDASFQSKKTFSFTLSFTPETWERFWYALTCVSIFGREVQDRRFQPYAQFWDDYSQTLAKVLRKSLKKPRRNKKKKKA